MIGEEYSKKWRFWPVILLSSFYTINGSLISLGIPILFFQKGISIEMIGFLSAAQIIAYCFSPLLFNKISDKLGRKNSLIIAMVGISCAQITYFFLLEPLIFLIARFAEGVFLGFFAPNLQASISDNPSLDHSKYLSRLSLSFNSGGLIGLIFGALFLFFINEIILVFYIAPLLVVANVIIVIFFFQESISLNSIKVPPKDDKENSVHINSSKLEGVKYYIPVLIPIIFIFGFSFAIGSASFIYPIKSEILGFQSYSAYFLFFFATFAQTISTYKASMWSIKRLKSVSLISLISIALIIILFGINNNFFGFIILFIAIGFFAGILYGSTIKFFMILNLTKQTSKYSSIMESLTGISYFVTQIIAGFLGGITLELAFFTLSIILMIIFVLYLFYLKKIK